MSLLNEFIKVELNNSTKRILLEAIDRLIRNNEESEEFTFNEFSVIIYPKKHQVIINDDIFPDKNPPLEVSLEEFYLTLEKK